MLRYQFIGITISKPHLVCTFYNKQKMRRNISGHLGLYKTHGQAVYIIMKWEGLNNFLTKISVAVNSTVKSNLNDVNSNIKPCC